MLVLIGLGVFAIMCETWVRMFSQQAWMFGSRRRQSGMFCAFQLVSRVSARVPEPPGMGAGRA